MSLSSRGRKRSANIENSSGFLDELIEANETDAAAVLATVVQTSPNGGVKPGDKCLIRDGKVKASTIGSQPLLQAILREAERRLQEATSRLVPLDVPEIGGTVEIFFEVTLPRPKLIVVGAGHIALPLVKFAKILDFEVIVIDDRVSFANRERFPDADEVLVGEMAAALKEQKIDTGTYIVLITRGHKYDEPCLREIIHSPAKYIGMIGSKRRVKACFQRFQEEDRIAQEIIERVYAPIGIDINAETPEEIAVCILAEIIKVRRGGKAQSLSGR